MEPLLEQSNKLNSMKIVALAFAAYRTGIAAISVDRAKPALRNVGFIGADDLQAIPGTLSIRLSRISNQMASLPGPAITNLL